MEIRAVFRNDLRKLQDSILVMGSMVANAINLSVTALKKRDLKLAQEIITNDVKINALRFNIEESCIQLIVRQQPLASDLRIIISSLNIITELERIGDYAVGIANITIMIGDEPPLKPLIDIPHMAEKTIVMLNESLDAFINNNAALAQEVCHKDNEIDLLYDQVHQELIFFMVSDPVTITRATRLLWVGHNLERSADRVTNICERVVYMVTGEMKEIGASKY